MSAHSFCTHPATKSARAACRRAMKAATQPAAEITTRLERELAEYDKNPGQMPEPVVLDDKAEYRRLCEEIEAARNAKKGQGVTVENWREFRDLDVEIIILNQSNAGQAEYVGRIVAWGPKRFSYRSKFTGTLNHAKSPLVVSVVAVKDQD
ncbi:hypothetical protein SEA_ZUKO_89 [Streptomyces phage Zuko]|uniref:Uncharacterized protein n=1 Tax=Streptomyces phage Zuko TaxID=2601695 RepID=A0A5J6D780_9CAUD|nr:hypothetical protein PP630_gp089 [Streptomyces phage Zuko]QEQ93667.1 hypothetical protein SEA_ZUKO_89 [Streptomyces phage Zuko]